MRIIQVGVYPPPYGGVSNHLKRLLDFLIKKNIDTLLIDTSKIKKKHKFVLNKIRKFVIFYLIKIPKSIIHFHGFDLKTLFLAYILSYKHLIVLSLHNEWFLDQMKRYGKYVYKIACFMMKRIDRVIVSNKKCFIFAKQFIQDDSKLFIAQAFIPPFDIPRLDIEQILEIRRKHKYLISSNAFKIDFYNGVEVYGIDLLIELIDALYNHYKIDVAMVFLLPGNGDQEYYLKMQNKIREYFIQDRFVFITKPIYESSSLWNISDIVIRATSTDVYSLTISEAQYLGIPTISSDCVERPEGSVLFKSRDSEDLIVKTVKVLEDLDYYKEKAHKLKVENNAEKILKIYESLS